MFSQELLKCNHCEHCEKFEYDNFFNHINLNIPEQWMLEIVSFKAKKIAKMCPTGIIIEVSK